MISFSVKIVKSRDRCLVSDVEYEVKKIPPLIEPEYRRKRGDLENFIYTKVGEKDVNEYINSFANGCSLKAILDRCQLMPIHDKVKYLQQNENGVSADVSNLPKDGTEAYMLLSDIKRDHPDIVERFAKGESFDSVLKSLLAVPLNNNESEVVDNGTN